MNRSHTFFDTVFQDVPDNLKLNIWTMPDKKSYWRKPPGTLPAGLDGKDIYYGVGLSDNKPRRSNQRLKADQVAGITCLWADIDFGDGHAKIVPPDEATCDGLLRKCKALPSIIVHSGNGWHCYWLFESPWVFADDGERSAAAAMVASWQEHMRQTWQAAGYGLDATHDLTRVLRVPGTQNLKDPAHPKPVVTRWPEAGGLAGAKRYSHEQLYSAMGRRQAKNRPGSLPLPSTPKQVQSGDLMLDSEAEPPERQLNALLANSEEFQDTWNHKRPDLADPSPSGYDMALASLTASSGWSDQEIADLIIAWRRKWGHDPAKALRPDYIKRTIAKSRVTSTIDMGTDVIESREEITGEKKEHYLEVLTDRLGFAISRVIKQGDENSQYSIILPDDREIFIGTATDLLVLNRFRARVFDATQISVPAHKQNIWHRTCEALARMADFVEDADAIESELVGGWIDQYVSDKRCRSQSDDEEYVELFVQGLPYIRDNQLHLQAMDVLRYIKFAIGHKQLELSDLRRSLRKLGFASKKITARHDGKVHGRNYWVGPKDRLGGSTEEVQAEKTSNCL